MKKIGEKEWKILKRKLTRSKQINSLEMGDPEKEYIRSRGMEILNRHAFDFVRKRLASANPRNDGRQTPFKGHPIFLAQHSTGTSDRVKLEKFHGIRQGIELTEKEIHYIVDIIMRWIREETSGLI